MPVVKRYSRNDFKESSFGASRDAQWVGSRSWNIVVAFCLCTELHNIRLVAVFVELTRNNKTSLNLQIAVVYLESFYTPPARLVHQRFD